MKRPGLTTRIQYTVPYAGVQHERTDYQHRKGGKAKYLSDPAKVHLMGGKLQRDVEREQAKEIKELLARNPKPTGVELANAQRRATARALNRRGQIVLGASQAEAPIRTGRLRESGEQIEAEATPL